MRTVKFKHADPSSSFPKRGAGAESEAPLRYTVELVTPMFGGGVEAGQLDPKLLFRAKSLRGQLRFWWRLLARQGAFGGQTDWSAIFSREIQIWGGVTQDRAKASQVQLTIDPVEGMDKYVRPYQEKVAVTRTVERNGIKKTISADDYLVDAEVAGSQEQRERKNDASRYVLFPAQKEQNAPPKNLIIVSKPTKVAVLTVTFNSSNQSIRLQVELTILWWATFGGLGARSRRGLGSVRVKTESGQIISLVDDISDPANLRTHTAIYGFNSYCRVGDVGSEPRKAWRIAFQRLRDFRQGINIGRNPGPGRSRWPEPDSIRFERGYPTSGSGAPTWKPRHPVEHPDAGTFPRAAFGMPIGIRFHYQQSYENKRRFDSDIEQQAVISLDPWPHDILPEHSDRMASPVIIKAVPTTSGKFVPAALCLPLSADFWNRNVRVGDLGSTYPIWNEELKNDLASGKSFEPLISNRTDRTGKVIASNPIDAFINFFLK